VISSSVEVFKSGRSHVFQIVVFPIIACKARFRELVLSTDGCVSAFFFAEPAVLWIGKDSIGQGLQDKARIDVLLIA